ncbi:MAG: DUF4276 family protein [Candidatus Auribacter fodinae]|jgi:hypothetical protein|uniref:DUF4276 family protein n=1 Tax=Candidatus Auribacter fodinae TaxID=2093366 RepID=A0A3A4R5A3_9BACT|nr:MAG: DUF4276 family protein [Candidatus Auribacter fodinae]
MINFEFLLEEQSAKEALEIILPKIIPPDRASFSLHGFNGKGDLLRKLERRLTGYRAWINDSYKIIILIDSDNDDCHALKHQMEQLCRNANLFTKTYKNHDNSFSSITRIAIKELESWFLGAPYAIKAAYPRVPEKTISRLNSLNPDTIKRKPSTMLLSCLQDGGYYKIAYLPKVEVAKNISLHMDPMHNRSTSFKVFIKAITDFFSEDANQLNLF